MLLHLPSPLSKINKYVLGWGLKGKKEILSDLQKFQKWYKEFRCTFHPASPNVDTSYSHSYNDQNQEIKHDKIY